MTTDVIKRLPGDYTNTDTGGNKTFNIEAAKLDVSNTAVLKVYLPCSVVTVNIKVHKTVFLLIICCLFCVVVKTDVLLKKNMNCRYV
jgi:hypothetical protein